MKEEFIAMLFELFYNLLPFLAHKYLIHRKDSGTLMVSFYVVRTIK